MQAICVQTRKPHMDAHYSEINDLDDCQFVVCSQIIINKKQNILFSFKFLLKVQSF